MSLQEVSPEALAQLFHHYHQVLAPEFGDASHANNETWQFIPEPEKKRLITAARLALTELAAEGNEQQHLRTEPWVLYRFDSSAVA